MQGSIRWRYLPGDPHIQGDGVGHGTCVASKVAGTTFAKNVNIVIKGIEFVFAKQLISNHLHDQIYNLSTGIKKPIPDVWLTRS